MRRIRIWMSSAVLAVQSFVHAALYLAFSEMVLSVERSRSKKGPFSRMSSWDGVGWDGVGWDGNDDTATG